MPGLGQQLDCLEGLFQLKQFCDSMIGESVLSLGHLALDFFCVVLTSTGKSV